eukprot:4992747-Alexandrium_andersonii.AAC.1
MTANSSPSNGRSGAIWPARAWGRWCAKDGRGYLSSLPEQELALTFGTVAEQLMTTVYPTSPS